MRILFKILLFPISLVLTIFVAFSQFLVIRLAVLLNIVSIILFIGVIGLFIHYLSGWPYGAAKNQYDLLAVIGLGIVSFLLSPYGLAKLLIKIISMIDDLNYAIKSI